MPTFRKKTISNPSARKTTQSRRRPLKRQPASRRQSSDLQRLIQKPNQRQAQRPRSQRQAQRQPRQAQRQSPRPRTRTSRQTYRANLHPKSLRLIPLGGLEEVGKNCTVLEYENDMIIIDLGLMFPNEQMPGIDYVVPDISYLVKNKQKIKGIVITHGHLDHIGAIPYLVKKLGNPKIFATKLTSALVKDRLEEFKLEKQITIQEISPSDTIQLGCFKLKPFRVNHNIPDGVGYIIDTALGKIIHTSDFKFDHSPLDQKPTEFGKIAQAGNEGVLCLMSDSTNAESPGYAMSEKRLSKNLSELFEKTSGRIIISTFATLISRLQQIVTASLEHNRKVAVSGMSLEKTLLTAMELGFINIPKSDFIPLKDINKFPDNKITIICTGSQGQGNSALGRMSRNEHRQVKIKKGDLIILSSSPIPGNERSVQNLMNSLFKLGARVIYNKLFDVHVSGHGYQEELKLMLNLTRPEYFVPIHGERHMLERHKTLACQVNVKPANAFVLANGNILEFLPVKTKGALPQARLARQRLPNNYVMVDGLGIGDVGNVVLRDRQLMSQDGMFVIIVTIKNETAELLNSPDIISRGFIYMRESEKLLRDTRQKVRQIVKQHAQNRVGNWAPLKNALRDDIGLFLFKQTERRPMILPVVIEV